MKEFISELDDFPGSFSLPDPFLDRHMRVWWQTAIPAHRDHTRFDWEQHEGEWKADVQLITEFGKWNLDGVPVGDLTSDGVPSIVKAWVMREMSIFILPFVPAGMLRQLVGIT